MAEPAAVVRARSLLRHITRLGAPREEFFVPVSVDEGFQLLRWFRRQVDETQMNLAQLDHDIERAKKRGDPFPVLEHFCILGLAIKRREGMN